MEGRVEQRGEENDSRHNNLFSFFSLLEREGTEHFSLILMQYLIREHVASDREIKQHFDWVPAWMY